MKIGKVILMTTLAFAPLAQVMAGNSTPVGGSHSASDRESSGGVTGSPFFKLGKYIKGARVTHPDSSRIHSGLFSSTRNASRRDSTDVDTDWGGGGSGGSGLQAAAQEAVSHYVNSQGNGLAGARSGRGSMGRCYKHVKYILKEAGCMPRSMGGDGYAKNAGKDLLNAGFHPVNVASAQQAPKHSVVVYQCGSAGHIEVRGNDGFYSDFKSSTAYGCRDFKVYAKRGC